MPVRRTSIDAYYTLPETARKQSDVLKQLREGGPQCNAQLAAALGWPVNTVTPRVHELRNRGLVTEAGRAVYPPTNRTSIFWRVVEPPECEEM